MFQDGRRRIIGFLTETKSHCNGFYSHNANAPKIHPSVEQNLSAPFLAFHVGSGCYTLNLWLAFFCGQSSCSVQRNHPPLDNEFNSCRRREEDFHPHMKELSLEILFHLREFGQHMCISAVVICIVITGSAILSFKCGEVTN